MWGIKRKKHQTHWSIIKSVPAKRERTQKGIGAVTRTGRSRRGVSKKTTPVPAPLQNNVRRIPASDEPLAFCAKCGDWTPMLWLPKETLVASNDGRLKVVATCGVPFAVVTACLEVIRPRAS